MRSKKPGRDLVVSAGWFALAAAFWRSRDRQQSIAAGDRPKRYPISRLDIPLARNSCMISMSFADQISLWLSIVLPPVFFCPFNWVYSKYVPPCLLIAKGMKFHVALMAERDSPVVTCLPAYPSRLSPHQMMRFSPLTADQARLSAQACEILLVNQSFRLGDQHQKGMSSLRSLR
jgi:hypothetical protein